MHTTLLWIMALSIIWALAYIRISHFVWIPVTLLLIVSLFHQGASFWILIPGTILFLGIAILFSIPILRRRYLSERVFTSFRKVLPPMSTTEREALDAGDVWWDKELFCGRPHWKKLLVMPKPALSAEEQSFLDNQVETLCSMLDDWKIVNEDWDLPPEVWAYLKKERFMGMAIGKEYGGRAFSALAHSSVIVKIASRSVSAAVNAMVPNSLGPGELLQHYGTEEQKKYYLPRLVTGEDIPCFALTGPEAGSDAASMQDTGIVCKGQFEGKEIIGIRLNFNKRYITLAPIATLLGLAFKMRDPDGLIGNKKNIGITLCLIPTSTPGIEKGTRHDPMCMAFLNGPIRGKDVFIPLDWIIGGSERAGQGWRMLMESLSIGRAISLPALSASTGQFSYRLTGAYARLRKQFKMSIGKFEGIEEALARIGGNAYLLEATRVMTANAVDQGVKPAVASAIAKYHMTETMRKVINDSMDIHGGRGIQLGPRNYLTHNYLAVPIGITVEGANILTRNLIIFGQGAIRCHPYVRYEIDAASESDPIQSLKKFDRLLFSHIGYAVSNLVRLILMSLTGGRFLIAPVKNNTARYYRQLTRMSTALAFVSDITMMLLGGALKRKERLSARLGDVLSHLYIASAILKYYENQGSLSSDQPYVHWGVQTSLYRIQYAFDKFFENFPKRWLGTLLRILVFPFGRAYRLPFDKWDHIIASGMQSSSELRDRLTHLCYLGKGKDDPVGRIEHALRLAIEAEEAEKKYHSAIRAGTFPVEGDYEEQIESAYKAGVISKEESNLLKKAEQARRDAMQVDEFSFDYLKRKH